MPIFSWALSAYSNLGACKKPFPQDWGKFIFNKLRCFFHEHFEIDETNFLKFEWEVKFLFKHAIVKKSKRKSVDFKYHSRHKNITKHWDNMKRHKGIIHIYPPKFSSKQSVPSPTNLVIKHQNSNWRHRRHTHTYTYTYTHTHTHTHTYSTFMHSTSLKYCPHIVYIFKKTRSVLTKSDLKFIWNTFTPLGITFETSAHVQILFTNFLTWYQL